MDVLVVLGAAVVVEALDVGEDLHLQFMAGRPGPAVDQLLFSVAKKDSAIALSKAEPARPIEASRPDARSALPNS
jgi:hypothetical protein